MRAIKLMLCVGVALSLHGLAAAETSPVKVKNLRCEYRINPLGLGVLQPRLSWIIESDERDQKQTAYRIWVASSKEQLRQNRGDLWDSGKVESDQSVHVVYAGTPLRSGQPCFWKVQVWDRNGKPSAESDLARWEMGLLDPSDWTARWITMASINQLGVARLSPLAPSKWIWLGPMGENPKIYLRRTFRVDSAAEVAKAMIKITADERFVLHLNGRRMGTGRNWSQYTPYEVREALVNGTNVIAVEAENWGGPCGVIAALRLEYKNGQMFELVSDDTWLATLKVQSGWKEADFSASGWVHATVLAHSGEGPWGEISDPDNRPLPTRRALCFRKEFSLSRQVAQARAYVSGLGCYELRINGNRIGPDIFAPGWTDYRAHRIQYQTYDVTDALREGRNAVAAIVGSGWWNGMDGRGANKPRLLLQLIIEQADKKVVKVVTDETWITHLAPILEDSFYHGEIYDAALEMPGWDRHGFDDNSWSPVEVLMDPVNRLIAQQNQTIQVTDQLAALKITEPSPGVYVFDFGQNAAGRCQLKVRGAPRGTRIKIRHAEVLEENGNISTANYGRARATDVYCCRGNGEEIWEPRFTYRGFRYAELTGYPGHPSKDTLVFKVIHSAVPLAGQFECSNQLMNRIWQNIVWSQRSNLYDVPTDCPQRDERFARTGDAQVFARTACWNMDMASFFNKWMQDIIHGGPAVGNGPGWADAVVIIPWTLYCFYGDKRIIEESYGKMVSFVESRHQSAPEHLYEVEGFGDHLAVVPSPNKPIGSAYYYYSAKLLSQMAEVIGRTQDARKYAELAEQVARAFNAAHLDQEKNLYPGRTQAAFVLPLYFGLVPADRQKAVVANLVKDIADRDYHLSTGFLGTAYLLPVLSGAGEHAVAYRLAVQRTYPSWGYMVERGATTMWEFWNSDLTGASHNHFALGSVGRWFFESLAGINFDPAEPGFKHIIIRPTPAGDLQLARAEYRSVHGLIRSAWAIKGTVFSLELTVPANTHATVYIPADKPDEVTEGGLPAIQAEGIDFIKMEPGYAVYRVNSGSFAFASHWSGIINRAQ